MQAYIIHRACKLLYMYVYLWGVHAYPRYHTYRCYSCRMVQHIHTCMHIIRYVHNVLMVVASPLSRDVRYTGVQLRWKLHVLC